MNKVKFEIVEPIEKSWTVYDIGVRAPPNGWEQVFKNSLNELKDISEVLDEQIRIFKRIYPDNDKIFRAFELTPLNKVKVVIFGQDPYHSQTNEGTPTAQGLAFSVNKGDKIPPTLKNIYTEIKSSYPEFKIPNHGDLSKWTQQGVLLCNACLTVNPGLAGSHKEVWMGFISRAIDGIVSKHKNCIFVLWGKNAQKLEKIIGGRGKILTGTHPSPLSAKKGFFGCGHFKMINDMLISLNKTPIDWNLN